MPGVSGHIVTGPGRGGTCDISFWNSMLCTMIHLGLTLQQLVMNLQLHIYGTFVESLGCVASVDVIHVLFVLSCLGLSLTLCFGWLVLLVISLWIGLCFGCMSTL